VRPVHAPRMTSWASIVVVLVLAFGAAGCGDDGDFANEARPPEELTVSTVITPKRVTVSPSRLGAGPVELLVSNQTTTSRRLTLQSETLGAGGRELKQSTGPINPGDTSSLKADLDPGTYTVTAGDDAIGLARIEVGAPRPSGQDRLLQP
jgi:hypothetical protein